MATPGGGFAAGQCDEIGGIRYRVRQGRKGPDDLVLELEGHRGFVPAKMALGALMADFFYQNEESLYPRQFGYRGGDMYFNFLLSAIRRGWREACLELEAERQRRDRRGRGDGAE